MFLNYRYSANCLGFCIKLCKFWIFSPVRFSVHWVEKKETVNKINMVYTLERATITICLSESDIFNYSNVGCKVNSVFNYYIFLCILSPNNVFALFWIFRLVNKCNFDWCRGLPFLMHANYSCRKVCSGLRAKPTLVPQLFSSGTGPVYEQAATPIELRILMP